MGDVDDELLAEAVDDAMSPVVDEQWETVRRQLRALYGDLGLIPAPWDLDELVALVRVRATRHDG